ncbi:MAG: nucleoside 2-deoxyribosyltransferase [Lentisphaerae bacterium]|jgi:nucleoside 2-deoxyribosyltransferase|nr:nucleoside 2-deoxyribosyltransferase [Lentisphaerota bacterium]MBT7846212.1 nucleoside 2-deoxyribosyltransferase [Lentisphaerota bacterium]
MKRVYLAGPDVFLTNALDIAQKKKRICAAHDLEGVFPLDQELDLTGLPPRRQGLAIFAANAHLMDGCDYCIANCTPFRGPSMDVGTAVEIGHMHALGKRIWGYTNVAGDYATRVLEPDGMDVEEFGLADNLMIEGAIEASGGCLVREDAPDDQRYTWLEAFGRCVAHAAG